MSERTKKVSSEIQKLVSEFTQLHSNKSSMITITRVDTGKDLSKADVFVSVFPEEKEEEAFAFLKRSEMDAREYMKQHGFFKRAPHLTFVLDHGEKNRRRIEEISA